MVNLNPQGINLSTGEVRNARAGDILTDAQGNSLAQGDSLDIPMSIANDQTVFTLAAAPNTPSSVIMIVNGGTYFGPTYFSVSGTTLTWFDAFSIVSTDSIAFRYT
jgi:hypothetical protein